ncbi:MAG: 23S rRNA (pseudouridine(1915)-N(3))-methyltransferase RlmH [Clostridiales bacterium]|jgi:23S rRNA (pseudouridine1915-N3)-methyltransferase|nr:23S rRNA (pseudouridine(1915)-N(3))-methyltransferase RlmH [Clostridiales bacterium]
MKINIIAVGNIKEKYFAEAFEEYAKRLTPFCRLECIETNECVNLNNPSETKAAEGAIISERLKTRKGFTIALDPCGETRDSEGFAKIISDAMRRSGTINFIIGGSNGLSEEILKKADKAISFGNMTFPHRLFRVMLIEQIYRAFMIINNREYHK